VIRLFRQGTNITEVGFFESQVTEEGFLVGACATGSIRDTNVKTGEVVQLEGEATFSCETPLAIGGSATFSGCAK
jgi:hypothetical protein